MPRYKHTQIGYVTGSAGLVGAAITYYALLAEVGGGPGGVSGRHAPATRGTRPHRSALT